MSKILVIDDEATLRSSMRRGLSKMAGAQVREAGSVDDALREIDRDSPDVIVSDIDLPDRLGIELLGELGKRGLSIPIIFVSAYLKAFGAQIPRHRDLLALEKPVALEKLREAVQGRLKKPQSGAPFSVPDYLQLSGMGRHSVKIVATSADGRVGHIVLSKGEPWCARFGELSGAEAFSAICFENDLAIACESADGALGEKNLHHSVDALLMEAARVFDEANRNVDEASTSQVPRSSREESAGQKTNLEPQLNEQQNSTAVFSEEATGDDSEEGDPVARMFGQHWEAGVDALLMRDYAAALDEFETAQALKPDDRKVEANIKRLQDMGIGSRARGE